MSNYPAPDSGNPQGSTPWGVGENNYTFPSQDQSQPSPYPQEYPGQPAAYVAQPGYQPQPIPQPSYQPPPIAYVAQPYQPQPAPYAPQIYVAQPQYMPGVPVVPIVAVYDPYAGQAVAGMVIGIIALALPLFWIMPILGIVFSSMGMRSTTRKGIAIAGLVCSIVAIVTAFCWFPFFFI